MAGYSGTPLPKKLGIKEGSVAALVRAPAPVAEAIAPFPPGSRLRRSLPASGVCDVIVAFVKSARALEQGFSTWRRRLADDGGLWIAWPKKSSGLATDLDENAVRRIGLDAGLVDNKVCAIDETWSGLRFVVRLKDRPARRQ